MKVEKICNAVKQEHVIHANLLEAVAYPVLYDHIFIGYHSVGACCFCWYCVHQSFVFSVSVSGHHWILQSFLQ